MTGPGHEVTTWTGVRTLHPELRLQADASPAPVLQALATGLDGAGFSIRRRHAAGLVARRTDLLAVLGGTVNRTVLTVTTSPDPTGGTGAGTAVLVAASGTGDRASGRAADGLSAAVRALRQQGVEVTVHPWAVPPAGR